MTIMELRLEEDPRPGARATNRWWEQDGLYLEGMQTADKEAERTEGEEDMDGKEVGED